MATRESTAINQRQETDRTTEYAFKPVHLGHREVDGANLPGCAVQKFAEQVESISMGTASILRLIEWDDLRKMDHESDPDNQPTPLLNDYHRGAMLRMMAAHMDMIAEQSNDLKRWAYEQHTDAGKAEKLADAMRLVSRYQLRSPA